MDYKIFENNILLFSKNIYFVVEMVVLDAELDLGSIY